MGGGFTVRSRSVWRREPFGQAGRLTVRSRFGLGLREKRLVLEVDEMSQSD